MKKVAKILGVVACAFVLAFSSLLLVACGNNGPYDVKGMTFKTTDEISFRWGTEITSEKKAEMYKECKVENEKDFMKKLQEQCIEMLDGSGTIAFGKDGTATSKSTNKNGETKETDYTYTQSDDLKTITVTDVKNENSTTIVEYVDGNYCILIAGDEQTYFVYAILEKV